MSLFVLRDERGRAVLALAAADEVLYRSRPDVGAQWHRGGELDPEELVRRPPARQLPDRGDGRRR